MSYKALRAVVRCPAIKGPSRRAALQIAHAHIDDKEIAVIGYVLMAGREGVCSKTIETGVKQLEQDGFVAVKRFRGRTNVYRLNLEKIEALEYFSDWQRARQQTASVPNTASVPKNGAKSTETGFQYAPKPSSAYTSYTYFSKPGRDEIDRPDDFHNRRTRLQWADHLATYRRKITEGSTRPYWPIDAGSKPDTYYCDAPHDLMQRYGFGEFIAKRGKSESLSRP